MHVPYPKCLQITPITAPPSLISLHFEVKFGLRVAGAARAWENEKFVSKETWLAWRSEAKQLWTGQKWDLAGSSQRTWLTCEDIKHESDRGWQLRASGTEGDNRERAIKPEFDRGPRDSWSLSHLGYLYPGTIPVMIKLDHNRSCPWV